MQISVKPKEENAEIYKAEAYKRGGGFKAVEQAAVKILQQKVSLMQLFKVKSEPLKNKNSKNGAEAQADLEAYMAKHF